MRLHRMATLAVAALVSAAAGCSGNFGFHYSEHRSRPVAHRTVYVDIDRCAHTRHCGHYHDGHIWVAVAHGHVHSATCGHHYNGTHWVVVRATPTRTVHGHTTPVRVHTTPVRVHKTPTRTTTHVGRGPARGRSPRKVKTLHVEHVHGASCGCAWSHGSWIRVAHGHVHRRGCGHVYVSGRWSVR